MTIDDDCVTNTLLPAMNQKIGPVMQTCHDETYDGKHSQEKTPEHEWNAQVVFGLVYHVSLNAENSNHIEGRDVDRIVPAAMDKLCSSSLVEFILNTNNRLPRLNHDGERSIFRV